MQLEHTHTRTHTTFMDAICGDVCPLHLSKCLKIPPGIELRKRMGKVLKYLSRSLIVIYLFQPES